MTNVKRIEVMLAIIVGLFIAGFLLWRADVQDKIDTEVYDKCKPMLVDSIDEKGNVVEKVVCRVNLEE